MPGKCKFNDKWLEKSEFANWLARDGNIYKACCSICQKSFDISNMGEAALTSHAKSKKHQEYQKSRLESSSFNLRTFFPSSQCTSKEEKEISLPKNNEDSNILQVTGNQVLFSEILWALKVVSSHQSYNSCKQTNLLFQKMFPDSAIAKQFTCGEKKCAYLCCFGIAPHFKALLAQSVKQQDAFVLLFDETLNQKLQKKQMDYYVRIWEGNQVKTKYFDSSFLGHATAEEMLESISNSRIYDLPVANVFQLSMDGPNVNWKFFDLFQQQLKSNYDCTALNTGSCGLHVVNGAFKVGCEATGWDVKKLLTSLYYHFHNSPAKQEDFIRLTNSTVFPLQFCAHRWVENVKVAERALVIWSNVLLYVEAVLSGKQKAPKNKSFELLKESARDLLMPAKIACFKSVASVFQPFLLKYQTDKPMLPFLSEDLVLLLKNLLVRFLKPEVSNKCSKVTNYLNIELDNTDNHLAYAKIDVGFTADKMIKALKNSKKISDRQYMEFKLEVKQFLLESSKKILKNCPLRYAVVREMACLNPKNMKNKDLCVRQLKNILQILVENKKIAEYNCDVVLFQFRNFLDDADCIAELILFNAEESRIDSVLFRLCKEKTCYKDLWKVFRILLLLSHGQASVERGFSVNKQIEVENLKEESIVSQRLICDHISSVGGILNVDISKSLLLSAAGARQKYMQYLAELKSNDDMDMNRKRKTALDEEIGQLKKRKKRLETDVCELLKSADDFAEKAETERNISMIMKSNSLRKTAKEKQEMVKAVETELDVKLKELKNI